MNNVIGTWVGSELDISVVGSDRKVKGKAIKIHESGILLEIGATQVFFPVTSIVAITGSQSVK